MQSNISMLESKKPNTSISDTNIGRNLYHGINNLYALPHLKHNNTYKSTSSNFSYHQTG